MNFKCALAASALVLTGPVFGLTVNPVDAAVVPILSVDARVQMPTAPKPNPWLMAAAGLGVVGMLARRRSSGNDGNRRI